MIKVLLTTMLLMLYSINIFSQDIPKKANIVKIYDTLTVQDAWKTINSVLITNGYGIENSNKETGTILTSNKPFKNGTIKLNILVNDDYTLITGNYKSNISLDYGGGVSDGPSTYQIAYTGQKNSVAMNAWNEMKKLIDQLPGKKEYSVK